MKVSNIKIKPKSRINQNTICLSLTIIQLKMILYLSLDSTTPVSQKPRDAWETAMTQKSDLQPPGWANHGFTTRSKDYLIQHRPSRLRACEASIIYIIIHPHFPTHKQRQNDLKLFLIPSMNCPHLPRI